MFDIKNPSWRRRFIIMVLATVVLGLGICLFKLSLMGADPHSSLVLAIGGRLDIPFAKINVIVNVIWFTVEVIFARKIIGAGTFINWFGVGVLTDMWTKIITSLVEIPEGFLPRILILVIGTIILSMACSLYQTTDMGIAPYDCLSLLLAEKLPIPYFWCRMFTDGCCALGAFLLGGVVGLGTLICALGMGPIVGFCNRAISIPLVYGREGSPSDQA